ncbi:EAL domain-containing protein [Shewanella sp. WXL01]|uniref:EAL domain-containing protein n=1 Tax=Shewanella sp. WXL01 TaxID=2709721 RepID=UPI0014385E54|nr:EAL domain-containing protein [Shewanella sp. WXL01]NKF52269.1 EAL domain-containing protein [Shewanella sp. WXL01]
MLAYAVSTACFASPTQRVFDARDGLTTASIHDIAFDHYGFTWLATEQGLYRASSSMVRRIDKVGFETILEDETLFQVEPLSDNLLFLNGFKASYLYQINENQFTKIKVKGEEGSSSILRIEQAHAVKHDRFIALTQSGRVFWLDTDNSQFQVDKRFVLPKQDKWKDFLALDSGEFIFAAKHLLHKVDVDGNSVQLDFSAQEYGEINALLYEQGKVWVLSSKGLFHISFAQQRVTQIPDMNYHLVTAVVDEEGVFWLGGYDGLIKWDPESKLIINYQQEIKSSARIDYIFDLVLDDNGLIWLGGSGGRLAVMSPPSQFIKQTYTSFPPFDIQSEVIWSVYSEGDKVWLGADGGVNVIDMNVKGSTFIELEGFIASDSIYHITALTDDTLIVTSTNGIHAINKTTNQSQRFADYASVNTSLAGSIVISSFIDPAVAGRVWFPGSAGLFYWEPGATELTQVHIDHGHEAGELWFSSIIRDSQQRLWVSGSHFGYFDDKLNFHSKEPQIVFEDREIQVSQIIEVEPNVLWLTSNQNGLFQLNAVTDELIKLDRLWQVNCSVIYFIEQTKEEVFIGCEDSILKVNRETGLVEGYPQRDGFISDEFNEAATFYRDDLGLFVGTPNGAMLIDPDLLENRIVDDKILLESVVVYYDEKTSVSLVPKPDIVVDPGASLISFQIASFDYLNPKPLTLQYRLNRSGERKGNYFLLDGKSQINISGLKAGDYTLELKYMRNGLWTTKPFVYPFHVKQFWWQSNQFKGLIILLALVSMVAIIIFRQNQISRFKSINHALTESDDRLRQALKGSESDLWEWRDTTKKIYLENRGGILGSQQRLSGHLSDIPIHPDDLNRATKAWNALLKSNKEMIDVEYRYRREDDQWRWLRVRGRAVSINPVNNRLERAAGIFTDVTQQKELESEITLLAEAFENTSEGMLILDDQKSVKVSNAAANVILSASSEELVGRAFSDLVVSSRVPLNIDKLFGSENYWSGEREFKRFDGDNCPVWLNISKMLNKQGAPQHYVVVFSDITERKQNESNLKRLANNDILTGLANRAMFSRQLKNITSQPNSDEKLALMFLDLDRFKHVNDSYGHSMGDALLVEAAKRLQSCLTEQHILCRFGGDEFVILLRDVEGVDQINHIAEQLLHQIETPFNLLGREFFISTSIGISIWPDDSVDAETLIKNADLAMYHAKEEGRGLFRYYSAERNAEALYHLRLEADLRKAIEQNEFELHYQPQINILHDDQFVGMEALIRWKHPQDGYVRPDIFIAVAESCGLVVDIDRWVLKQACIDGARWQQKLSEPFRLSVNISAVHFRQPDFISTLAEILAETGMESESLALEITEGVLMKELQVANENLSQLKKMGIEVAIDDFGTGYSSLAYLSNFEVNTLKIDRSFLINIANNKNDQAIVSSITELARNLHLDVVAEGVETLEQLEQVFARGCYIIQGYYFAKPMPRQELDAYLKLDS